MPNDQFEILCIIFSGSAVIGISAYKLRMCVCVCVRGFLTCLGHAAKKAVYAHKLFYGIQCCGFCCYSEFCVTSQMQYIVVARDGAPLSDTVSSTRQTYLHEMQVQSGQVHTHPCDIRCV